ATRPVNELGIPSLTAAVGDALLEVGGFFIAERQRTRRRVSPRIVRRRDNVFPLLFGERHASPPNERDAGNSGSDCHGSTPGLLSSRSSSSGSPRPAAIHIARPIASSSCRSHPITDWRAYSLFCPLGSFSTNSTARRGSARAAAV